jgi:hypothetical protein
MGTGLGEATVERPLAVVSDGVVALGAGEANPRAPEVQRGHT